MEPVVLKRGEPTTVYGEDGELVVTTEFTQPCHVCGATVEYSCGEKLPHRCRIELGA